MSATSEPGSEAVPLELLLRVEQICDPFENAWLAGQRPRIEDYLGDATGLERATLLRELLRVELECRHRSGEQPGEEEYQGCFPDDGTLIRAVFRRVASMLARPANPDNAESRAGRADEASPAQSGLPTGPYSPGSSADESTVTEPKPSDEAAEGVLFGDYVLLNQLGRGGMGVVYRARQRRANRIVALKIIRPDLLEDVPPDKRREVLERFQTEAKAAANIEHDHVVTVYEVGEIDGQPFYSMRYVEGRSLGEIQRDGPVPNTRAARYVERVADAVHFIHSRKILHRDLKPKNILVDDQDRPYVTDFGLARWLEGAREVTQRGDWLGSPPYMSPEQARDSTQVTEVSDVYSLGATLYALLTGRPPFQAATVVETLHQVQDEEPVSPRRLNTAVARDLETITLKCLHKEPARRYRTAEALAEDLRCYLEDKPLMHGRPVGQAERVWRWCRRNPWMATAATLVLLTVGTAFGLVTDSRNQALQLADDNADLAGKNAELAISEKEQRNQAEAEKKRAERESANLALQQGSSLYEQGDIGRALLLLARALDLAVRAEDAELERVIRTNLSLWRTRLNGLKALLSHDGEVLTVAFNRDGTKLLTGSTDRTVRVWDAVTGRPAREPLRHDTGTGAGPGYYEHWAQVVATAFSPDGRLVATGTGSSLHRGRSQLWEPGLISPAGTPHRSSGLDQILSRRGSHLLGGLDTRFERAEFGLDEYEMPANLWDLATGQPLHRSRGSLSANQPTWAVAFSPDGRTLLTAGGPLLNEDTAVGGTVRATLDLLGRRSSQKGGRARFWDPATRRPLPHSLTHENAILAVAFSPQGKLVVTGSADRTARVWETDTGRPVGRPYRHEGLVLAVAFSHDGRRILTASANSTAAGFVQLWDVDSGEPLGRPFAHPRPVLAAAFSPDSRIIAAGCGDPFTGQGEAYLWDVATGQPVGPPPAAPGTGGGGGVWPQRPHHPDGLWRPHRPVLGSGHSGVGGPGCPVC